MTRPVHMVDFGGETMPLYKAAKIAGLSDYCVRKRFQKGERGGELFRPSKQGRFRKPAAKFDDLAAKREAGQAAERTKEELKLARQRREVDARARAMSAHAAAFSRPLIDATLLKPKERLAIRERVKFCGQRNWCVDGGKI
jgi:hypothetical protein